jgi:RNA polymerase sigma factor (sigma-70 family)
MSATLPEKGMRGGDVVNRLAVGEFLRLWDGDRPAALRWYQSLVGDQMPALRRRTNGIDSAEDLMQDAFLVLSANDADVLRRARPGASMAGWHWKVLLHLAMRLQLRTVRRIARETEYARCHVPAEATVVPLDTTTARVADSARADDLLRCLSPAQRAVLHARLRGLSLAQVAAETGIAKSTARDRLAAAVEQVRRCVAVAGGRRRDDRVPRPVGLSPHAAEKSLVERTVVDPEIARGTTRTARPTGRSGASEGI